MVRAYLPAVVVVWAGFAGATAADQPARPFVPAGGLWQSIPYAADAAGPSKPATNAAPRIEAKATASADPAAAPKAVAPKAHPVRHPVAAAAASETAPPATAAARARELERRLDILSPGVRLGEPIADPDNPSWRRPRPGRPAGEHNSLSLPFDESGKAGLIGRGYHVAPDAQNTNGSMGATFGLRTRF